MKHLTDRKAIAQAINIDRIPVVRIDLADSDEYGLKSQKVLVDNGTFRDGTPYLIGAEIRAYADTMKFEVVSYGTCLKDSFSYYDMEEMLAYANAPVLKKDSDVVIAVVDSENKKAFAPAVLHTGDRISAHCMNPIAFTDEDNNALGYMASANPSLWSKWCEDWKRHNNK